MKKWEYKSVRVPNDINLDQKLNEIGSQGWEPAFSGQTPSGFDNKIVPLLIFKREIPEPPDQPTAYRGISESLRGSDSRIPLGLQ